MEWPHILNKVDVIAIVADGIATWLECIKADLIALVADGKLLGQFILILVLCC